MAASLKEYVDSIQIYKKQHHFDESYYDLIVKIHVFWFPNFLSEKGFVFQKSSSLLNIFYPKLGPIPIPLNWSEKYESLKPF